MKSKAQILIVEDETGVSSSLERMLEKDHDVRVAASCEEARQSMAEQPLDLAIVDLVLPDGDGFSLLQELRRRPELPEVIIITGDNYEADEKLARALKGEAFYFLTKPFDAVALEALVQRSLEVRRLQQALRARSEELERDLKLAREFQARLMPRGSLMHGTVSVQSWFVPCDSLAGDFFDYRVRKEVVYLIVADVVGHGVSAAMLAGMLATTWSRAVREDCGVQEIHGRLLGLVHDWEDTQFFSAFFARIGPEGRTQYLNAGHPAALLHEADGTLRPYPATHPKVSPAIDEEPAEPLELTLHPGSRLLLYTDGIPETRNPRGDLLMLGPIEDLLREGRSAAETLARLGDLVEQHQGGRPREDDLTALLIECK